ncbi:hypothetical protein AKJ16_DCAP15942 [Drosera capensis]
MGTGLELVVLVLAVVVGVWGMGVRINRRISFIGCCLRLVLILEDDSSRIKGLDLVEMCSCLASNSPEAGDALIPFGCEQEGSLPPNEYHGHGVFFIEASWSLHALLWEIQLTSGIALQNLHQPSCWNHFDAMK